ncbi:Cilia- and flagella-associated protein 20, partial [Linum perenne]
EYYTKKNDTYAPVDYASIGAASDWVVEGDGASPPPDLDIDSFEQDFAGEEADPNATLGIKLPFLVMLLKNLKKYFTFEIKVLDD